MRRDDHNDAAGRILVVGILLGLLIGLLPSAAMAQADEAAPIVVAGAIDVSGEVGAEDVLYQWEIADSAAQWRIELEGPPEESMRVQLSRGDGDRLALVDQTSGSGLAYLNDLALDPGTWFITVVRQGDEGVPYELRTLPEAERFDPEPNGEIETAATLVGTPFSEAAMPVAAGIAPSRSCLS